MDLFFLGVRARNLYGTALNTGRAEVSLGGTGGEHAVGGHYTPNQLAASQLLASQLPAGGHMPCLSVASFIKVLARMIRRSHLEGLRMTGNGHPHASAAVRCGRSAPDVGTEQRLAAA